METRPFPLGGTIETFHSDAISVGAMHTCSPITTEARRIQPHEVGDTWMKYSILHPKKGYHGDSVF